VPRARLAGLDSEQWGNAQTDARLLLLVELVVVGRVVRGSHDGRRVERMFDARRQPSGESDFPGTRLAVPPTSARPGA
jgi:hypothetical protein